MEGMSKIEWTDCKCGAPAEINGLCDDCFEKERNTERSVIQRGDRLIIQFPYSASLLNVIRELPDRQYNSGSKVWYVPAKYLNEVRAALTPLKFRFYTD